MSELRNYVQHRDQCVWQRAGSGCDCGLHIAMQTTDELGIEEGMSRSLLVLRERELREVASIADRMGRGRATLDDLWQWIRGRPTSKPRVTDGEPLMLATVVRHAGAWQMTTLNPAEHPTLRFAHAYLYPFVDPLESRDGA